jgi:hypothetical protein
VVPQASNDNTMSSLPAQVLGKHPRSRSIDQSRKKQATLPTNGDVTPIGVTNPPHKIPKASKAGLDAPQAPIHGFQMPKGGYKLGQLPSVIFSMRNKYFATLYDALFASQQPFEHFKKNSALFLAVSRRAFKKVWPGLDVELESDDTLFNIVGFSSIALYLMLILLIATGLSTRSGETRPGSRCRQV